MFKIYKLDREIYRNQLVVGKSFSINGFDITKFKRGQSSMFQKFIKEMPEGVCINFWNIGEKVNLNDYNKKYISLKNLIDKKYKIFKKVSKIGIEEKNKEIWFKSYKEQLNGIIKNNKIKEENFFAYSLPLIFGGQNNWRRYVDFRQYIPEYIDTIKDLKFETIFSDYEDIKLKAGHPNVFVSSGGRKEGNIDSMFEKHLSKVNDGIAKDIIYGLYNYFCDVELKQLIESVNKEFEKKKSFIQNSKDISKEKKEIIYRYMTRNNNQYEILGEELFGGIEVNVGNGFYFYPQNSVYLEVFDLTFNGRFKQNGEVFENQANLGIIKSILKEHVSKGNIEKYIIKVSIIKMPENIDYEYDMHYYYVKNDNGNIMYKVPFEKNDIPRYLSNQEKKEHKFLYGLTIGIYGKNKAMIDEIKKEMYIKLQKENVKILIDNKYNNNIFEKNNRLSMGAPDMDNMNESNFIASGHYMSIIPEIKEFDTKLYFGLDYLSETPVLLDPFVDLKENKNMIIIGRSGSGKTVFAKQLMLTNHSDKMFCIDPVGTLYNLSRFEKHTGIKGFKISDLEFNPIYIDIDFYNNIGYSIGNIVSKKIDLLFNILGIDPEDNENNWQNFAKMFVKYIYKINDYKINIDDLKEAIFDFSYIITKYKDWDGLYGLKEKIEKNDLDKFNLALGFKDYLLENGLEVNSSDIKLYISKINTNVSLNINNIDGTIIGNMLKNKKDIIPFLFKERFVVFNIQELGLVDMIEGGNKKNNPNYSVLLYILTEISNYTAIHKDLFDKNRDLYESEKEFIHNYIVIDEAHILLKDKRLLEKINIDIRTVRNRKTSIVLLSQSLDDILKMGKAILQNIAISIFFKYQDALGYANEVLGVGDNSGGEDTGSALKDYAENIKLYLNELKKKESEKKKLGIDDRYVFVDYDGKIMLNKSVVSTVFDEKGMYE